MTMFQQRLTFSCAVLLLLLSMDSCKREEQQETTPPVEYSITFKIDGVEHTYTRPIWAATFTTFDPVFGTGSFSCVGMRDTALVGQNHIYLHVRDTIQLQTNITYTNYTTSQPNERGLINGELGFVYYTADGLMTFTLDETTQGNGIISDARLTIIEVTPEYVRGRFSATLYDIMFNAPIHVITDGSFTLRRI